MTPLSILDLARVTQEVDARGALDNARDLAAHAETLGLPALLGRRASQHAGHRQRRDLDRHRPYRRRHEDASASAQAASCCPTMRPIVIAEQFGTLARLFPGRIDLGLGRAPGTDQLTLRALRRTPEAAENFPQDVLELQAFLAPAGPGQRIQAVPAAGTRSAAVDSGIEHISARCSPPSSACLMRSPRISRPTCSFRRWTSIAAASSRPNSSRRPYAMVGVNIIAAESDDEARRLATTQQMSFTNIFRGARGLSQPPIDDIESYWSPAEKAQAMRMLARSIVGSPAHGPRRHRGAWSRRPAPTN